MKEIEINWSEYGKEMHDLIKRLYPICRSITGNGVRETLKIIKKKIPIEIKEVPTGSKVFDWTIPKEWNIKNACIKNSRGEIIIDFKNSNLHVLNYSVPINKRISLSELKKHLFTLPDHPDWIPYLTTYYEKNWGFCITHNQYKQLKDDIYEVVIDSTIKDGYLTYGELFLEGYKEDEVLLTCYICHPSLCNDNLSGPALLTILTKQILKLKKEKDLENSYRFLFIPETIGAITWLYFNENKVSNIKYGLVATCLGDAGKSTYKKSRIGNTLIDKIAEKVLIDSGEPYEILEFDPIGSDERQFCSPGFNLPVGSLMRTPYARYPEYHTSADNLDFVNSDSLINSLKKYTQIISILENNKTCLNLNPKCEPQLGKRGLYSNIGGLKKWGIIKNALLWTLNLSDGTNSLLDIAIRSKINFDEILKATYHLLENGLLKEKTE